MNGPDDGFLGRGWTFPPRFSVGGADLATVAAAEDIRESLMILFATEPGERAMRPDYGAGLMSAMFAEVDQRMLSDLTARIRTAILFCEPRIALDRVDIAEDAAVPGLLSISLTYAIRGTNSRYNMVFPFYVREATGSPRA
jgi:phage baseplate assembly protein W